MNFHRAPREKKPVTATEVFVVSKEEQHQSLQYINEDPHEICANKFPTKKEFSKKVCNECVPHGALGFPPPDEVQEVW